MADRTRNFGTILYPESAKPNWKELLDDLHIKILISPLHNMDCDKDGEVKKEHYHIIYIFDGKKSDKQVQAINESIGSVGLEKIQSLKGMARYLCHLDNPDKHKYNPEEVVTMGNLNYMDIIKESADKYTVAKEILTHCRENGVICYCDIIEYAINENMEWFIQLVDNPHIYINYLKSLNFKMGLKAI